jgi:predicted kinase
MSAQAHCMKGVSDAGMQSVARSLITGTLMDVRHAHLILITGMPGTGKSTLAGSLARYLGVPLICKDAIKEPLLDVIGAADRAESRRLSDASFAVMFALARECLRAGTDLILEGNFRAGEHEPALSALIDDANANARSDDCSANGVHITQILCQAPEHVRIARLKARSADPSRHPGHRDADLAVDVTLPDPVAGAVAGHIADVVTDPAVDVTADYADGRIPSTADFLALPSERFVFDSHANPAELKALFNSIEQRHRARPHV